MNFIKRKNKEQKTIIKRTYKRKPSLDQINSKHQELNAEVDSKSEIQVEKEVDNIDNEEESEHNYSIEA